MIPCLIIHGIFNGIPIIVLYIFRIEIAGYSAGLFGEHSFQPLYFDLLGVALVGLGLFMLWKMFEPSKMSIEEE